MRVLRNTSRKLRVIEMVPPCMLDTLGERARLSELSTDKGRDVLLTVRVLPIETTILAQDA